MSDKSNVRIENWSILGSSLHGEVYGHPNFDNGKRVQTSTIVSRPAEPTEGDVIMTNNTRYVLGREEGAEPVSKRRTSAIGEPMMVKLPPEGSRWENTAEGGMAFFLIVPEGRDHKTRRQVCIAGSIVWPEQDVQLGEEFSGRTIDAGLLIGSTGLSLWDKKNEEMFAAKYENLTEDGKWLHDYLIAIYGDVKIVTLLDT